MQLAAVALFRCGKLRFLYLLALAQLVGGPLVLLQVMLFSKLVISEAPRVGVVEAVSIVWDSPEFRESLVAPVQPRKNAMGTLKKEGKAKTDFPTAPVFPWMAESRECDEDLALCGVPGHYRIWTPRWPNAPPGPPPRIA
jgi:hypothetical protein